MKCNNCGYECGEDFAFCPNCSAQSVQVAQPIANPVGEKVMAALRDNMFLVICILMTASAFLGLASDGIPVFQILFSIFLWIAFAKSRKNIVDTRQLKNLSGTVYAQYVVFNVASCIIIICGIVSAFLMGVLGGSGLFDSLPSQFGEFNLELSGFLAFASGWLIVVGLTVLGGIFLVLSLLGWRKIHRFAKSIYKSIESYTQDIQYAAAAKNWVLILGIVEAVSSLTGGDFSTILASGCYAASAVLAYMLINKYLTDKQ